jgi:hypothetical protein
MNSEHTLGSKRVSMLAPPIPVSAASPFDAGKPLNFDEYGVRDKKSAGVRDKKSASKCWVDIVGSGQFYLAILDIALDALLFEWERSARLFIRRLPASCGVSLKYKQQARAAIVTLPYTSWKAECHCKPLSKQRHPGGYALPQSVLTDKPSHFQNLPRKHSMLDGIQGHCNADSRPSKRLPNSRPLVTGCPRQSNPRTRGGTRGAASLRDARCYISGVVS